MQSEADEFQELVDRINRTAYATADVVDWYDRLQVILKPEEVILKKITPAIRDKRLLDIGIGGGRTTRFLLEISRDYTGIDYKPGCVEIVRGKYPNANILCEDARDLRAFGDAAFDFVLFSFNAIDWLCLKSWL